MARVTLVELYSPLNMYPNFMPTVGPYILAELARRDGHKVSVICDYAHRVFDERVGVRRPELLRADVVGFSIMTATASYAYAIADAIRQRRPGTRIVFGGPHATFRPEEALRHGDVVVLGEGENVFRQVLEDRCPPVVRGTPVEDLDSLPWPDYSISPEVMRRMRYVPVSTSRGCPYDCSFCSATKMFGRRYRFRSPEHVVEELEYRVSLGQRRFFFTDDHFAAKPSRTRELLRLIAERRLPVHWAAQVRTEIGKDRELLRSAAHTGCDSLLIGFESPSDEVLKSYHKRQTADDVTRCVNELNRAGLSVHGLFMLGSDEDDADSLDRTMTFCKEHRLAVAQFSILTPFPGTDVFRQFEGEGRIFARDWPLFDGAHVVFRPARMTALALQKMWIRAWKRFYSLSRPLYYLMCRVILHRWQKKSSVFKEWVHNLRRLSPVLPG